MRPNSSQILCEVCYNVGDINITIKFKEANIKWLKI